MPVGRTFTVTELTARVRQYADIEAVDPVDGFITDAEIMGYLSDSYTELYDILVNKGLSQYEKITNFTNHSQPYYDVPVDFYGVLRICKLDGNFMVPLKEIPLSETHKYPIDGQYATAYRLISHPGGSGTPIELNRVIRFYPHPNSGHYVMFYVPFAPKFTAGTNVVNGVNGWEDYIAVDAALKCAIKEESTDAANELRVRKQELLMRIDAFASNQTSGPRFMHDAEHEYYPYDPADWRF
jgi:hypothetical protein